MKYKITSMLLIAFLFSLLLELLNVPANWLLGSLFIGMIFSLTKGSFNIDRKYFKMGLIFLGSSFGVSLTLDFFPTLSTYTLPIILTLVSTIIIFILLSRFLYKHSSLDMRTAVFCCIPGGASEVIGSSKDAGADESMVAAFHSSRIILYVLIIPIILGASIATPPSVDLLDSITDIESKSLFFILLILPLSFLLEKLIPFPIGILFISMMSSFMLNHLLDLQVSFQILPIIGQIVLGVLVGQKLTVQAIQKIRDTGAITFICLLFLLISSFLISWLFSILSGLSYPVSLLATVPAGAPEMSSTAFSLNIDPSTIVAIQTIRVITIFLLLPVIKVTLDRIDKQSEKNLA